MLGTNDTGYQAAIDCAANHSPYLRDLLQRYPELLARLAIERPEALMKELLAVVGEASNAVDDNDFSRVMRNAKSQMALVVALSDLAGRWTLEQVTDQLTQFADAAVQATVDFLLRKSHRMGKIRLSDPEQPSPGSGYVVLAMGKHGAHELNYSSDIDLIILYDPDCAPLAPNEEPSTFFVRLTRNLVSLLQDITEDGYVFRVDLRLRPDPRATQVAIAIEAAAVYYENLGQNWERAAMIKARPVAGDLDLGKEFLDRLKPYIWRKYLDFAAIADVQSLKRQIHAVKGHGEIAVQGHNLKLGRGGIREIEFFVQTQQLIAGGRNINLRGQQTLQVLGDLATAGWISSDAVTELSDAYRFLRKLEHRVQMLDDAQDHCVPTAPDAFENYAKFAGFADGSTLSVQLQKTLESVQRHYQALFETADELSGDTGNLVFTGGEDDPGTLQTLAQFGFQQPSEMSATIRGWHFGRYNATRSKRSRELLTELMPQLLRALAETGDADQAFLAFDRFLQSLPAGVQLFSMLKSNTHLLNLLARILGAAPRLAAQLSRQPRILEAVLERNFFGPLPTRDELEGMASFMLTPNLALEEAMDRARILGREQMFRVGVRVLSETVTAQEAGQAYSNIADTLLSALHHNVTQTMQATNGKVNGGSSAIIAMGKLGGREMTAASDLDLILVYDHADDAMSDGQRPLSPSQYYTSLTQKLIASITSPTAEGTLFDVDMRLRPTGSKGPVAVSLSAFKSYQQGSAWTWEKMALTRARIVTPLSPLTAQLQSVIISTLAALRDNSMTLSDILDMRKRMLQAAPPGGRWDIKHKRGGMIEVEFLAQALQLLNAYLHPHVLKQNTGEALTEIAAVSILEINRAKSLIDTHELYGRLTQLLRLCVEGSFRPATATPALKAAVCRAALMPDMASTEALLDEVSEKIKVLFNELIGNPDSDGILR
jgi:[glutamine synthetase] adenylyltransferase / [glutamine synthetase]-adenylyl-L-tyrosine phosphorylase